MAHVQSFEVLSTKYIFVIQFHPHWYPAHPTWITLIGTLLLGTTFAWFTSLLEHKSPLLYNFEAFLEKFNAIFGYSDK
jgi:hypothetical protein